MLHGWEQITQGEREVVLSGIRDGAVYGGPFHAEFSPTDACNYDCFFCNAAFVDRSQRLKWDVLRKVTEDLIDMGVRSVRLAGGGEPLIHPQITDMLDLLLERRINISNVTTNAFGMRPKVADRLLKIDTTEIIVSFNDVDAKRYAATNGTTERAFDVVLDNIRGLLAERRRRGLHRPKIVLQFFLWKENHADIEIAYDLALELGVDHIYIRDMWGIGPEKRMTPAELAVARAGVERLVERDKDNGILLLGFSNEDIYTPPEDKLENNVEQTIGDGSNGTNGSGRRAFWRPEAPTRTEYCYIGWYSTVIRGNGEVFPCCMLANTEGYPPLGNVHEASFAEIWHGPQYTKLREELRAIAMGHGRFDSREGRHCLTFEFCAMRDACPFVKSLASPDFYAEVDGALDAARHQPAFALERMGDAMTQYRPFLGAGR